MAGVKFLADFQAEVTFFRYADFLRMASYITIGAEEPWLIGTAETVGTNWLRPTASAQTVEPPFTRRLMYPRQKRM